MIRWTGFKDVLYSSRGLSPKGQSILTEMTRQRSILYRDLGGALAQWRKGSQPPRLNDFASVRLYRDLLGDIQILKPPTPGIVDRFVISTEDYAKQGQLSLFTPDGKILTLTLEDAFNQHLSGVSSLTTGSGNTFETSNARATAFFKSLKLNALVKKYLALDPAWWPYNDGLIPLVEKNILTDVALVDANSIVNTALKMNPDLASVVDFTHSYGNFPKAAALTTFNIKDIPDVRVIMSAPLGIDLDIAALLEVKNRYLGKVTILRPGIDPLEELLSIHQTLFLRDGIYDQLPTDFRLATNSHKLDTIADVFQKELVKRGISFIDFNERFYTTRPSKVTYFRESDGTITPEIEPRSGTIESYLEQYDKAVEQAKTALNDVLDTQLSQLQEVLKYASPTPDLESLATSIKGAKTSLSSATSDTLPDLLNEVSTTVATINTSLSTQIATATQNAQKVSDSGWEERVQNLDTQIKEFNSSFEEARTTVTSIEDGTYEPKEV